VNEAAGRGSLGDGFADAEEGGLTRRSSSGRSVMPLPFSAPPEDFDAAAIAAMGDEDDEDVIVDGEQHDARYFRVVPGTDFELVSDR